MRKTKPDILESTQQKLAEVRWSDLRNRGWLEVIWKGSRNHPETTQCCENGGMQERVPEVSLHMVWFYTGLSGAQEMEATFESVVAGVKRKPGISLNSILWNTSSCIRTIIDMILLRPFPLVLLCRKDNLGHPAMLITGRVTHTCCAKMYL